ncbi:MULTISPECIES: transporter substrate-binding domain-containing protein [Methylobacillus]|uniref:Amino acid/amide ABC transporter substrate-binding protein, HAAT family n=1 Tax=Methylobacillus flagellatus (strain ATCC 51484 / DSM 6875 / VKM B-1610 / KT) TaxID=265072 RepID=Q1H455_METFK|nr:MULTISPECIES: transporter substrate-binding domain-containing protein [Methylobacillus]ABE48732.1 amino acid/amide ABC transporter substrate-binding protein, HAAT family [Methylobacillus flagellatus KT]MPS49383.1 amino acid ABC transporter substrate-binding protein [Methylobacillus sp.]
MASSDPIHVGVLFSSNGATATIERTQAFATFFAISEINAAGGINGRELIPIYYDPRGIPRHYQSFAERMIRDDKVNVIFGCYMSSTRKAVIPVVEKWRKLLFYPTPYEGFEFSPHVIYTGPAPNQNSAQLADYMTRHFGARIYLVGSDYIYPYESNRIMSDFILETPGGKKLAERYLPLDASEKDFIPIVRDIKAKAPDFIFSTVVGKATRMLYQAYADIGMDAAKTPIASLTTCEAEIAEMGCKIAAGHITSAPYFQSIASEHNQSCLARFRQQFGEEIEPNMCWEAAYFQTQLFAEAMREAGDDSYEALLPRLLGREYLAPQGKVAINPANHHTRLNPRLGRVNAAGGFDIIAESIAGGVEPDPYLVSHTGEEWSSLQYQLETKHG